jgi:Flp pilus assembly protein TadD
MYAYSPEQLGRNEEALRLYADVVRRWPRDQEALCFEAKTLMALDRYPEGIDRLLAAAEIGPLSFHAVMDLGRAYTKTKDVDNAIDAYEAARHLKPYDTEPLDRLQYLYRMRGRHQDAYEAVRTILRVDPKNPRAQRLLPYLERNRGR